MAEGLEALLRSAQAALSAASATLPSAEERRAEEAAAGHTAPRAGFPATTVCSTVLAPPGGCFGALLSSAEQ